MIYKLIISIVFCSLIISSLAADDTKCLNCICQHESGCKPIGCVDGNPIKCGYFKISFQFYISCGTPGRKRKENIETAWKRCSGNYKCSVTCVKEYIKRNSIGNCSPRMSSCEKISRIFRQGSTGCISTSRDTISFVTQISLCFNGK
ncbi:hypothetical protein ACQ4LE_009349 [Meloidogyne hapla]|uniref:lysozyme n=1 Tax=Meloidogyne hapla TaxID=6305 RepID=A0A1I8BIA1_MELHA